MNQGNGQANIAAIVFVIAAAALAYFGWKKFQGIEQALATKPAPAKADTPAEATEKPVKRRTVVEGTAKLPLSAAAKRAINQGLSIAGYFTPGAKQINNGENAVFGNDYSDKIQQYAGALDRADREASKFLSKMGTTTFINTTLAIINALPDADFIQTLQCWQQFRKGRSYYESNLYKAKIDNHGPTALTNRIYQLNIGW